jgi:putative nucleotidyltransferase with HDIG domain
MRAVAAWVPARAAFRPLGRDDNCDHLARPSGPLHAWQHNLLSELTGRDEAIRSLKSNCGADMRGTPPIQRRPITDALRASIVEDLPEIKDIKDAELRAKVIEGWAFSLAGSSYQRISDLPGEGNPDVLVLKRGNQTDHLRGVAHFAMKMVEEFETSHPEVRVDRDIVLAGALCHDIGKPYEFDPVNRKRWAEDPSRAGDPCLRHSVYGAHVCLSVGLPEEIAHIALGHSLEGQHIGLSTECYIVRHADHSWWHIAGALGLLKPETLIGVGTMMRARDIDAAEAG